MSPIVEIIHHGEDKPQKPVMFRINTDPNFIQIYNIKPGTINATVQNIPVEISFEQLAILARAMGYHK